MFNIGDEVRIKQGKENSLQIRLIGKRGKIIEKSFDRYRGYIYSLKIEDGSPIYTIFEDELVLLNTIIDIF